MSSCRNLARQCRSGQREKYPLKILSIVLLVVLVCSFVQHLSSSILLQSVEAAMVHPASSNQPCNLSSSGEYTNTKSATIVSAQNNLNDVNHTTRVSSPSTYHSTKSSAKFPQCVPNTIQLLDDGTMHMNAWDSHCRPLTNQSAEDAFDAKGSLIVGVVGQPSASASMFQQFASFADSAEFSTQQQSPSSTPAWQVACNPTSTSPSNESLHTVHFPAAPVCWVGVQESQPANATTHLQMMDKVIRMSDLVVYVVNELRVQDTRMIAQIARFLSHRSKRVVQQPQLWVVHDFASVAQGNDTKRQREAKVKADIVDAFDAKRCEDSSVNNTRCFTSTSAANFPITHWVLESTNTTLSAEIYRNTTHNMNEKLNQQAKSIRQRKVNIYRLLRSSMRRQQFQLAPPHHKHMHSDSPQTLNSQLGPSSHQESEAYWSSVRSLLAWSRSTGIVSSAAPPVFAFAANTGLPASSLFYHSMLMSRVAEGKITVSTDIVAPLSSTYQSGELMERVTTSSSLQTLFDKASHFAEVALSDADKLCVLNSLLSGRRIDGTLDFFTGAGSIFDKIKMRPWTGLIMPAILGFALNMFRVSHVRV